MKHAVCNFKQTIVNSCFGVISTYLSLSLIYCILICSGGESEVIACDSDQKVVKTPEPPKAPSPELIHFSLPRMEDDYDEEDSDLDTER